MRPRAWGWLAFKRGLWALAGGVVLSVVAAVAGGMLGEAGHDRGLEAIAGACSPDERSEFQALGASPTNDEYGTGNRDGSCQALIGGRDQSSLDQSRRVAEGRGWKPDGDNSYQREGRRLRIEVRDEGDKGLDITLRILAEGQSHGRAGQGHRHGLDLES
jgi:hypothetical protein